MRIGTSTNKYFDVQLSFQGENLSGGSLSKISKEAYLNLNKIVDDLLKHSSNEIDKMNEYTLCDLHINASDGKLKYCIDESPFIEVTDEISKNSFDNIKKIQKYAIRTGLIKDTKVSDNNIVNEVKMNNESNFLQKIFGVDLVVWIIWFISLKDRISSLLNIPQTPSDIIFTVLNGILGMGMLYEGVKSYVDSASIGDEEGIKLAKYKILQGVITIVALVCLALVTYYLLPMAIAALSLTSGIIFSSLCIGYTLYAFYNMRKNKILSKQIDSFLNNSQLTEKQKLRGALAYLRDKIICEKINDHAQAVKSQAVKLFRSIRRLDSGIVDKIKKADSIIESLDRSDNHAVENAKELIKEVQNISTTNYRNNLLTGMYGILQAVILVATVASVSLIAIQILGGFTVLISVLILLNVLYSKFGEKAILALPAKYEWCYKLK